MSPSKSDSGATRVPVIIVGGGPVGLAMAVLLDRFSIGFVVVERDKTITDHPKARGCDIRSMELFRQWGVGEKIAARGLPAGSDSFAFVESMVGREFGRTVPELNIGQSPAWRCMVSQDVVQEELLAVVRESKVGRVLYETDFVRYDDSSDGVVVETRNLTSGAQQRWRAEVLIGADGAGSTVRRQSSIEMRGPLTLAVMANEYWLADLSTVPRVQMTAGWRIAPHDPAEAIWTVLNTNGRSRWLSAGAIGRENDERTGERSDAEVVALARKQSGVANLDVKVISRSTWRLSRQVASNFRESRVFLIGDAAHRFPPNGGFGMNSGIHDAHNLAWKLKLVFDGKAGVNLLESYDLERRPVAESNADFSLGNQKRFLATDTALRSGNRDEIEFWIKDTDNHLHSSGQSLGFAYEEGAVVQDGTARVPQLARHYVPSDRPGGRFPHWWTNLSRTESTLNWFDRDLVLVAGPKADAWLEAARDVAAKSGVAIATRQLDDTGESKGLRLGVSGALLVRPDGHVAWRMPWLPSDPRAALATALDAILCRSPEH